jgi:DNA-directed RNA polymerase subunit RPC12/RpoP
MTDKNDELESAIIQVLLHLQDLTNAPISYNVSINRDLQHVYELMEFQFREESLLSLHPEIARQWHTTKNGSLTPAMVTVYSGKYVWWTCDKGHEWQSRIAHRVIAGCPYCSGRYSIKGVTDLATVNPILAKEWHSTRNGNLSPDYVTAVSGRKVCWKCSVCGHEWQARVSSRNTAHAGCPKCGVKRVKKNANVAIIHSRGSLVENNPSLAQEWHPTKNGDLLPSAVTVSSSKKVWWLGRCGHEWHAAISKRNIGRGCPYCSGKKVLSGFNDLATKVPQLIQEWDFQRNGESTPHNITFGSGKLVWWKCLRCGHEWQARVAHRSEGRKCPNCHDL